MARSRPCKVESALDVIREVAPLFRVDPLVVGAIAILASGANPNFVEYEKHSYGMIVYKDSLIPDGCGSQTERRMQMFRWGLLGLRGYHVREAGIHGWLHELLNVRKNVVSGCKVLKSLDRDILVAAHIMIRGNGLHVTDTDIAGFNSILSSGKDDIICRLEKVNGIAG